MTDKTPLKILFGSTTAWFAVIIMLLVSACASDRVIDLASSETPGNYQTDLMTCEHLADQAVSTTTTVLTDSAIGTFLGAAGAVGIAMLTNSTEPLTHVAAIGAIGGGLGGAVKGGMNASNAQYEMTSKCLIGRGYTVLQ